VLAREPSEIGAEKLLEEGLRSRARGCRRRRTLLPREECRSDAREILALQLRRRVHAPHRRVVDPAFERLQRGPGFRKTLRQIGAIEKHRVVARKIIAIVGEHDEARFVDLGVSRIDVDRVDLLLLDGIVRKPVIEPARRGERKVVRLLQSRPAVGAADEFLRQPQSQLGMRFEIGQLGDVLRACVLAADRQRVGIVEAERNSNRETYRAKLRVELGKRRHRVELENFLRDRAGVFGVDVDVAARERVQHNRSVAEPLLMHRGRLAGSVRGLLDDLPKDVALGEALRADVERRRGERRGDRDECGNARSTPHRPPEGKEEASLH